jgi:aminoglycoside phosphotransferase (APT) family kinase protein
VIDASLVRRLIADQFPLWAHLEVWPVEFDGHDNRTFHLGDKMSARMPTRDKDAAHITIEQEWLPKLGPQLPLPIPVPVGKGSPGPGYPFPWSVNSWVPGHNALPDRIADLAEFAKDLADFLNALQLIGTTGAPGPGRHTYFRGCDPSVCKTPGSMYH